MPNVKGKATGATSGSQTPSEFMDRLTDFMGDSEGMTTEEVKAELREEGIDIDAVVESGKTMIKEMIKVKQNIKNEETHQITLTLGEKLFIFSSFDDWCNTAQRHFAASGLRGEQVLCVDTFGRVCRTGREFMRARDEGAFPVRVFAQCF